MIVEDNYEDIIDLEYKKSNRRSPMSIANRSAQFAPFSALTGYAEAINEAYRLTSKKIEIDDQLRDLLNKKLIILKEYIKLKPEIIITYFIKDKNKTGGEYATITGNLNKIKELEGFLELTDKTKICLKDIISIDSDIIEEC